MSKPIKKQIRGKLNSSVIQLGLRRLCVQENVCVHVEAGERGAGGPLSDVDIAISMCISSHTLVYSSACNGRVNVQEGGGREEKMMSFYLSGSPFCFELVIQELQIKFESKLRRHRLKKQKPLGCLG